jgi:hypothetical protein
MHSLRAEVQQNAGSGLWLPPQRPERRSVKAQAANNFSAAQIKVVGVGGGGSNAVNRMLSSQLQGVELMVMNTDAQVRQAAATMQHRIPICTTACCPGAGTPFAGWQYMPMLDCPATAAAAGIDI